MMLQVVQCVSSIVVACKAWLDSTRPRSTQATSLTRLFVCESYIELAACWAWYICQCVQCLLIVVCRQNTILVRETPRHPDDDDQCSFVLSRSASASSYYMCAVLNACRGCTVSPKHRERRAHTGFAYLCARIGWLISYLRILMHFCIWLMHDGDEHLHQ